MAEKRIKPKAAKSTTKKAEAATRVTKRETKRARKKR